MSVLWQYIVDNKILIQNTLRSHNVEFLRYRDLSWRIEARVSLSWNSYVKYNKSSILFNFKISSRCLLYQVTPITTVLITLDSEQINDNKTKLTLVNDNSFSSSIKTILFQIDPTNLVHIIDVLEQALAESKTHRTRNTLKAFQANSN